MSYQLLYISENAIRVGWVASSERDCDAVILQGFALPAIQSGDSTVPEFNITVYNSTTATIPSDQLTSSTGDPIVYRLIAVDDNQDICSQSITQGRFYRFDGMCN